MASGWYSPKESADLLLKLTPGDLLEFARSIYKHWAVYVGYHMIDGKSVPCVIHRGVPDHEANIASFVLGSQVSNKGANGLGKITLEPLMIVWEDSACRINNSKDKDYDPFPANEVVQRAFNALKFEVDEYNLLTNNCEHFVNRCRYSKKKSAQVDDTVTLGFYAAGAALVLGGALIIADALSDSKERRKH